MTQNRLANIEKRLPLLRRQTRLRALLTFRYTIRVADRTTRRRSLRVSTRRDVFRLQVDVVVEFVCSGCITLTDFEILSEANDRLFFFLNHTISRFVFRDFDFHSNPKH